MLAELTDLVHLTDRSVSINYKYKNLQFLFKIKLYGYETLQN